MVISNLKTWQNVDDDPDLWVPFTLTNIADPFMGGGDVTFTISNPDGRRFKWSKNGTGALGAHMSSDGNLSISGNIMSLISESDYPHLRTVSERQFYGLFQYGWGFWRREEAGRFLMPATTLAKDCYAHMYEYSAIRISPKLPAKVAVQRCYDHMFYGTEIFQVDCNLVNMSASNCTNNWLGYNYGSGTFKANPSAMWPVGDSGIPNGWKRSRYVE